MILGNRDMGDKEMIDAIHYSRGIQAVASYVEDKVKRLNRAAKELESLT
jgi:hypothetical protein